MIAVIDYGMGNLQSVVKGLEKAGADVCTVSSPSGLENADSIVLPGVGAFEAGMANLKKRDLLSPITSITGNGIPLLGICLGMQLLFSESEEHGTHTGLGIIPGTVRRFRDSDLKIPHMGWNSVDFVRSSPLSGSAGDSAYFYFVHSYYCRPENEEYMLGRTEYGIPFCSAVHKDTVYGTQFHPEKSQTAGLDLLRNFVALS